MINTFILTAFAWIFFRAENIGHALSYISEIFSSSLFIFPAYENDSGTVPLYILLFLFLFVEWLGREQKHAIANLGLKWKKPIRVLMYFSILIAIFWFSGEKQQFIYFQF
jgi:D-alanyl-lipoteichoic acid acyltransferase DltB (MBOAT superfamily)